jgi:hypothetical protein
VFLSCMGSFGIVAGLIRYIIGWNSIYLLGLF